MLQKTRPVTIYYTISGNDGPSSPSGASPKCVSKRQFVQQGRILRCEMQGCRSVPDDQWICSELGLPRETCGCYCRTNIQAQVLGHCKNSVLCVKGAVDSDDCAVTARAQCFQRGSSTNASRQCGRREEPTAVASQILLLGCTLREYGTMGIIRKEASYARHRNQR